MTSPKCSGDDPPAPMSFLNRWSRRKRRSPSEQDVAETSDRHELEAAPEAEDLPSSPGAEDRDAVADITDADLPPLETLDENSDYSGFMSSKVSAESRRQALRKLFHQPKFNVRDKLDCHAGDFTKFEPLGDTITADMRHQIERAARHKLNQALNEPAVDELAVYPNQESAQGAVAALAMVPESSDEDAAEHPAGNEESEIARKNPL
ncbi:MAG: DUF3306 domain-containing protein [Gammaproteobacteria bacterium]|nr:DUF3306 domain-containing protein [Gammaproteobacteria bacterium]